MSLSSLAQPAIRAGQEFLVIAHDRLRGWAAEHGLSLRQAIDAALEAGLFPECFERNSPSLSAAQQLTLWRSSALVVGLGAGGQPGAAPGQGRGRPLVTRRR